MNIIYWLIFGMIISFGLLSYSVVTHKNISKNLFKSITSLFFIIICVASFFINNTNYTYFILILIALVFSLIGDILLEGKNDKMFLYGLISFALTHIFFTLAFIYLVPLTLEYILIPLIITCFIIYLFKIIKGFNFKIFFYPICLYIFLIVFMVFKAISLNPIINLCPIGIPLVITGAILFILSDFFLCCYKFYTNCPKYYGGFCLITYYIAQVLIALSVLYI